MKYVEFLDRACQIKIQIENFASQAGALEETVFNMRCNALHLQLKRLERQCKG